MDGDDGWRSRRETTAHAAREMMMSQSAPRGAFANAQVSDDESVETGARRRGRMRARDRTDG
jgi:hypothetical protein